MPFKLMILTAEPSFAKKAQEAGIDRIFYDLEYINKAERQRGRNTVISHNNIENIPTIRNVLMTSELLVRTNPIHAYSEEEIEKVIAYGADVVMLPMVLSPCDVSNYVRLVRGRAKVCIMIETAQAMSRIDSILATKGVDEIFIGLNDLHISLGLDFMFEVLSGGLVEYMANRCNKFGMPFGFGGIARIGEGVLPADKILGEHIRLGSQSVILSRTFKGEIDTTFFLKEEVRKVRNKIEDIKNWDKEQFRDNTKSVFDIVNSIIAK